MGAFEVTDYESLREISKSSMADQNIKQLFDSDDNEHSGVFGVAGGGLNY